MLPYKGGLNPPRVWTGDTFLTDPPRVVVFDDGVAARLWSACRASIWMRVPWVALPSSRHHGTSFSKSLRVGVSGWWPSLGASLSWTDGLLTDTFYQCQNSVASCERHWVGAGQTHLAVAACAKGHRHRGAGAERDANAAADQQIPVVRQLRADGLTVAKTQRISAGWKHAAKASRSHPRPS